MPGRLNRDVAAGALFVLSGAAGLWAGRTLSVGTPEAMGEGYLPRALCLALVAMGIVIAAGGVIRGGAAIERWTVRPLFFVTVSIIAFALVVGIAGLAPAVLVAILVATFAGEPVPIATLAVFALTLTTAVVVGFCWGLGLAVPVVPGVYL
ncbi:MAG: tripartite tricarboxylate transporter TctB family protein [Alphaproteobacteria bacterium]|nr:tripartite tricarboxylate transporter TctB family protein [Alphaproteobacteria bacterium]